MTKVTTGVASRIHDNQSTQSARGIDVDVRGVCYAREEGLFIALEKPIKVGNETYDQLYLAKIPKDYADRPDNYARNCGRPTYTGCLDSRFYESFKGPVKVKNGELWAVGYVWPDARPKTVTTPTMNSAGSGLGTWEKIDS